MCCVSLSPGFLIGAVPPLRGCLDPCAWPASLPLGSSTIQLFSLLLAGMLPAIQKLAEPLGYSGLWGAWRASRPLSRVSTHPASTPEALGLRARLLGSRGWGQSPPALALPALCRCRGHGCRAEKIGAEAPPGVPGPAWVGVPAVMGLGLHLPFPSRAPASWAGCGLLHTVAWSRRGLSSPGAPQAVGSGCLVGPRWGWGVGRGSGSRESPLEKVGRPAARSPDPPSLPCQGTWAGTVLP